MTINSEDNLARAQDSIDLRDTPAERERVPNRIARALQAVRGYQHGERYDPDVGELAELDLTIDEVAAMAKMTARNVRAYQQRRLLPPVRRKGRRLVYGWEHVSRLRLIRTLHGRGLSLRVIEDLVARGVEEEDLARIGVETAPGTDAVRVPIGEQTLDLVTAKDPQALADLVEAGVVHIEAGELVASSAGLGVAGALLSHGVDITTICRVVLIASRAANNVGERLQREIDEIDELDEQTASLAMRLASVTFSEALLDRVAESQQSCPEESVGLGAAGPAGLPGPNDSVGLGAAGPAGLPGPNDSVGLGAAGPAGLPGPNDSVGLRAAGPAGLPGPNKSVDLTASPTRLDDHASQDNLGLVPRQT